MSSPSAPGDCPQEVNSAPLWLQGGLTDNLKEQGRINILIFSRRQPFRSCFDTIAKGSDFSNPMKLSDRLKSLFIQIVLQSLPAEVGGPKSA
jgi:hypothetical protein